LITSCYQQIVNLNNNAGFRVIIIDVLFKICDEYSRFYEDLESIDTWLIYCGTPALKMKKNAKGFARTMLGYDPAPWYIAVTLEAIG